MALTKALLETNISFPEFKRLISTLFTKTASLTGLVARRLSDPAAIALPADNTANFSGKSVVTAYYRHYLQA